MQIIYEFSTFYTFGNAGTTIHPKYSTDRFAKNILTQTIFQMSQLIVKQNSSKPSAMSASFVCSSRGSAGQRHLSSDFLLLFSPFHPVTLQLPLKSGTPLWQNLTIETLKKSSKCSHESSPPTAPGMSSLSTRGPSLHPSGPRR